MSVETLVQLPNRDLWRGFDPSRKKKDTVDMTPMVKTSPEQQLEASGSKCPWCDQGFEDKDAMKAHAMKQHFVATHPEAVKEFLSAPAPSPIGQ